jgi:hypothetical protein
MTANHGIDPARFRPSTLSRAEPDLLRSMLSARGEAGLAGPRLARLVRVLSSDHVMTASPTATKNSTCVGITRW